MVLVVSCGQHECVVVALIVDFEKLPCRTRTSSPSGLTTSQFRRCWACQASIFAEVPLERLVGRVCSRHRVLRRGRVAAVSALHVVQFPSTGITKPPGARPGGLERATGIEPASEAWEASILPMNYARNSSPRRNRPVDHIVTPDNSATGVAWTRSGSAGRRGRRRMLVEVRGERGCSAARHPAMTPPARPRTPDTLRLPD